MGGRMGGDQVTVKNLEVIEIDLEKTNEWSEVMAKNAGETTFFVIQSFMNKFNAAAEELKDL